MPTAIKILNTDPISGAANNHNKFFGGACEANTRDLDIDNPRTEFYGFTYSDTKSIFATPLITKLGGNDSSAVRQTAMGMEFTNIAGDTQLDTVKLLTGKMGFPAVQVPTADPNTLDDYVEEEWTPTISSTIAGAPTYSVQKGFSIKIGKLVWVNCEVQFSGGTLPTGGYVRIDGLPFTIEGDANNPAAPATLYYDNLTGGSAGEFHIGRLAQATKSIYIHTMNQDGEVGSSFVGTRLTSTSLFRVSACYQADD